MKLKIQYREEGKIQAARLSRLQFIVTVPSASATLARLLASPGEAAERQQKICIREKSRRPFRRRARIGKAATAAAVSPGKAAKINPGYVQILFPRRPVQIFGP